MNPSLRAQLDPYLPFDAVPVQTAPDMSTFVIHNIVFTLSYSNATGETPLANPWYLTGGPLGAIFRKSDNDVHYHMKVQINDMMVAMIIHPGQCIICGTKSYLILLLVCNLITKMFRRTVPSMATFYFSSFVSAMENTVCRVGVPMPLNFDNLQSLLRPQFKITRAESDSPALAIQGKRRAPKRGKRSKMKITHNELSFDIPLPAFQRHNRPIKVVINFFVDNKVSTICINGIHSLNLVYEILKETVAFLTHHAGRLQYASTGRGLTVDQELYKHSLTRALIRDQSAERSIRKRSAAKK